MDSPFTLRRLSKEEVAANPLFALMERQPSDVGRSQWLAVHTVRVKHHTDGIVSEVYEITEKQIRECLDEYRKIVPRDHRNSVELRPLIINELLRERLTR